mgnify:CR=1 FL=1|tara:strand:+ start:115 stop:444 length:330 start_codon:yes stop_codon:yes gene_type:complete
MSEIKFNEWQNLDLRIGKVVEATDHPNADKLYILSVDIGEAKPRTIVAGIKEFYKPNELVGKKIVIFANLEPSKLRGVESNGMLLAGENDGDCVLLVPEKDIEVGTRIR